MRPSFLSSLPYATPIVRASNARSMRGRSFRASHVGSAWGPGAGIILASLRNPSTTLAVLVRRLRFGSFGAAVSTAAGNVVLQAQLLSAYSAEDTGGVALTPAKNDSSFGADVASMLVSNGAALTAGTRTPGALLKSVGLGMKSGDSANLFGELNMLEDPLVLRVNEGIEIVNLAAMPTSVTFRTFFEIEYDVVALDSIL